MTDRAPPFTQWFDLASLGDAEKTIELHSSADQRSGIAEWLGVDALDSFAATVRLRRIADDLYEYDASFAADVTQACVVTLDPLKSHLSGTLARRYRMLPRARRHARAGEPIVADDDETETLASGVLDVAVPVLEELALVIDPYPRALGAVFDTPSDADKPANPFFALEKLKRKR